MYIENIDHFVDEEKVEDTNEVARSHKSKDKQHNGQMKKDKQHNGQMKKDKQHNGQMKDKQHNGQMK
jgi:hypothetical protein